ncbi:class 1 fructose-bisphosphatase [Hyphomicrobium sp.]|uniref:class 1 fructose-bisphosphatase n=1 Tax=Hyphomicrobium sp. TaxID=82 RepID=UPI002E2EB2FD|nr:class 1 fructose-bisphosphatase [Hyphomicrobium sp.]HEX2841705.1 class 1 fructose-bisphosphatase [Hyphomicrobium sp.]
MADPMDLGSFLDQWAQGNPGRADIAVAVIRLSEACCRIGSLVSLGPLAGGLGSETGQQSGADPQKEVDVRANDLIVAALKDAPVATLGSEELEWALPINPGAPLAVAVDPIDGSSNIDANVSIGTIFTVLPARANGVDTSSFLQSGDMQLAAGFAVYGPFTSLVLTVGNGTHIFTLQRSTGQFVLTTPNVEIPASTREYAINGSNYRHWDETIRTYVDDCLRGQDGPRGKNFNMRWTASPVSDIYRILTRGGIFLYPGDLRENYNLGRLRLVYEANPLAWIIEQAGGAASTGFDRILDIKPNTLHQRTPIICGSKTEVEYLVRLHHDPHGLGERSPLFGRRGLFRI